MITLTVQEIVDANIAIQELPKLPVKASFQIARIREVLLPELKIFESERDRILEECGAKRVPKGWDVNAEVMSASKQQLDDLTSATCELNITPIQLSSLGEKVEIEPIVVAMLSKLLVDTA